MDMVPLRPLDTLFGALPAYTQVPQRPIYTNYCDQLVLSAGPMEHAYGFCIPLMLENSFLASVPEHSIWQHVFGQLHLRRNYPVLQSTGPLMLTTVVTSLEPEASLILLSPDILYPLHQWQSSKHVNKTCGEFDRESLEQRSSNRTIGLELWCGSWHETEL